MTGLTLELMIVMYRMKILRRVLKEWLEYQFIQVARATVYSHQVLHQKDLRALL